jgi:hypothetical protein
MAENQAAPAKAPIQWWGLPVGVIGIALGIWASFEYIGHTSNVVLWLFGILAYVALLGGVFAMGSFILGFIVRGINRVDIEANR